MRLADMTDVTDEMIARAVEWYKHADSRHFRDVRLDVMSRAMDLAGGDFRRIVKESPTCVTVYNRPMW